MTVNFACSDPIRVLALGRFRQGCRGPGAYALGGCRVQALRFEGREQSGGVVRGDHVEGREGRLRVRLALPTLLEEWRVRRSCGEKVKNFSFSSFIK